ncbi:hypothetical protein HID58_083703 [Brassica napus]|uniref:Uncharacterized protein n=1 Tax=Brassica napus TaxID=3708 RepID=A0ABQ7YEA9_BRANA|nr:hypothetical protein HID58_083703 [Brassica napus]
MAMCKINDEASYHSHCSRRLQPLGWNLPHPRSDEEVLLHAFLSGTPPNALSGSDSFAWCKNDV